MNLIKAMQTLSQGLLNPDLDLAGYHRQLQQRGWIVIEAALRDEVAEVLHVVLAEQVPWSLAYVDQEGSKKIWAEQLRQLSSAELDQIRHAALQQAQAGFSFLYDTYMMITAYQQRRDPKLPLHKVTEYLNQSEWLDSMRSIVGEPRIIKTSAQATRYRAGHYLTQHNDHMADETRYAAYVINLTKQWRTDWGGLLQFIDAQGKVTDTVTPGFNCISLFKTPVMHCVSPVADYATGERLSITGWLRGEDSAPM